MKLITAAALAVTIATPAWAQGMICGSREAVKDRLTNYFSETRVGFGMGSGGNVVEIWANLDTGSWTVTITTPNGMTCLIRSGQSFELLDPLNGKPT